MAKTITVELPERVTEEMNLLLEHGWFTDEEEIVRMALWEFVRRQRFVLSEHFQRADIAWAKQVRRDLRANEAGS